MNPMVSQQIESLIRIASQLIRVLSREVASLREMRIADLESLQQEKLDLTVAYEQGVRALADHPGVLDAVAPAMREALSDVAMQFDRALAANTRALNAARDSHDRLLRAIVDAVADKRARERSYDAMGRFPLPHRARRAAGLSLTFDRRL